MATSLGKKAEEKIQLWLDRPEDGYCFKRIPDQMTGFYMISRNEADFSCYKSPNMYYIESKETEHDRFDFSQLTNIQRDGLRLNAEISGVYGLVIVLFTSYQRAFIFNIKDIAEFIEPNLSISEQYKLLKNKPVSQLSVKSVNIKKIDKWDIPYVEIPTIPSRKELLDYTGELDELLNNLKYE